MKREKLIEIMNGDKNPIECKCEIFDGLAILLDYTEGTVLVGASHDVIYSIDIDDAISGGITETIACRLRDMGWMLEHDEYFSHFV